MWSTSSRSLSTQTVPCIFITFVQVIIQPRNVDRIVKRKICSSRGYKTIFWALRREIRMRNNILKCGLYLSDNTLHLHYKDHMLNAVQETNGSLFTTSLWTHKHIFNAKQWVLMIQGCYLIALSIISCIIGGMSLAGGNWRNERLRAWIRTDNIQWMWITWRSK
jgi:hypothetical protein